MRAWFSCVVVGLLGLSWLPAVLAQPPDTETLVVPFIDAPVTLADFEGMAPASHLQGRMAKVSGLIQRIPNDGLAPTYPTEIYLAYDSKHLHVVFLAFDDEPEKIRANMSPRENVFDDDNVNIMIDTFNDQRRAYTFLSNPLGVQWDGRFTEGRGFDSSYEAVWSSAGRTTDRGYMVLITIPFRTLRFPGMEEQTWRVMFNRTITRMGEESFWPRYSIRIDGRLNQAAVMTGIRGISPGRNIQIVPFGFLRSLRIADREGGLDPQITDEDLDADAGLDAKVVLKDSLVLDATVNPDFSQVESDEPQVTVNERFEVFFPERRPFFLENSDVFATPTNLVFTRRIVEPTGGIKLTGKLGSYSVGTMLIDDESPAEAPFEGKRARIGLLRVSRDVSEQSKLGFLFTHRELGRSFNRVGALDGRLKLSPNWTTQWQVASAATREDGAETLDGMSYNVWVDRNGEHFGSHTHYLYTSPGFRSRLGFLGRDQRPDSQNVHQRVNYVFRPEDSKINSWGPSLFLARVTDTGGRRLDWEISPAIQWDWAGHTSLNLRYDRNRELLLQQEFPGLTRDTDFARYAWSVEAGTEYSSRWGIGAQVDWGTRINFEPPPGTGPEAADFVAGALELLWRPLAPLRIDADYLLTELRDRRGGGRIFTNEILRVRGNWQFTKELSLRTILQYEETDPVVGLTSLPRNDNFSADVLLRYLLNPWSALYVGYTSTNFDREETERRFDPVLRERDGRQLFVKFSYLFQL